MSKYFKGMATGVMVGMGVSAYLMNNSKNRKTKAIKQVGKNMSDTADDLICGIKHMMK